MKDHAHIEWEKFSNIMTRINVASEEIDLAIREADEWLHPGKMLIVSERIQETFSDHAEWLYTRANEMMAAIYGGAIYTGAKPEQMEAENE